MRRITSLPRNLRPREKLLKYGPTILTIEELLAVILVTGTRSASVSQIAPKITQLIKKKTMSKENILKLGVGPSKAAQILAALELGNRQDQNIPTLTSPEQVFAHCHKLLHAEKESLLCFYLNARGELLRKEVVAVGTLNKTDLLPREIFALIKELPVAGIILAHNHPSGVLEASVEDIRFTQRVKLAGDILGIKLLDHLIVSTTGWKRITLTP